MSGKLFTGLAATVLSAGISSSAFADWPDMNLQQRRGYFKPEPQKLEPCPKGDDNFWSHWATQRGYEQLFHGNFRKAAVCYEKAGEMYRKGVAVEDRDNCFVCDSYERMGTILRQLPAGTINIRKETFEESAQKAMREGDRKKAATLFELTAIGYAGLGIEGEHGRFNRDPLHAERYFTPESDEVSGMFFEKAAELVSDPRERKRLLQQARVIYHRSIETGYRARNSVSNVERLDKILSEL
ncbi:MAG: hypothetical protein Q7K45_04800 [Nanoarchaeota archaeon]|nr:hypothetical protein [Nanoarchaeota archaeon]